MRMRITAGTHIARTTTAAAACFLAVAGLAIIAPTAQAAEPTYTCDVVEFRGADTYGMGTGTLNCAASDGAMETGTLRSAFTITRRHDGYALRCEVHPNFPNSATGSATTPDKVVGHYCLPPR
jgi:hypothetical protein